MNPSELQRDARMLAKSKKNHFTMNLPGIALGLVLGVALLALGGIASATTTGKITGRVFDQSTGEALIGATVRIEGTSMGAISDLDGRYTIRDVPFGIHALMVSVVGYTNSEITGVQVKDDNPTILNVALAEQAIETEGIKVQAKAMENTEGMLLRKRKAAAVVSDGISAEEISRSGSGDAAEAMTKVTGASVVGGKYVYVRGLGDRYSSVNLNGSRLPSPDPDRQSVPLDLVPSGLLDNIVVEKTFTPDKPGNFAGGSVNLGTKDYPESRTLVFSSSTGLNTETTNKIILTHNPSSKDWLGYDSGKRDVPSVIQDNPGLQQQVPPDRLFINVGVDTLEQMLPLVNYMDEAARAFNPEMEPGERTAPLNQGYSLSFGDEWRLFARPLGVVASTSYSKNVSSVNNGEVGVYRRSTPTSIALTSDYDLGENKGIEEVLWGNLLSLNYGIHDKHKIGFTYMFNRHGQSTTRFLAGESFEFIDPGDTIRSRVLSYAERKLTSLQLSGEHVLFGNNGIRADWNWSQSSSQQNEPDLRFFNDEVTIPLVEDENGDLVPSDELLYRIQPSRYPRPRRLFRDINEDSRDFSLNLTLPLSSSSRIMAGFANQTKDRQSRETRYTFSRTSTYPGYNGDVQSYVNTVGLSGIDTLVFRGDTTFRYTYDNLWGETLEKRNQYDGTQDIYAAYGRIDIPVTSWAKFVGGLRYETTEMNTRTLETTVDSIEIDNKDWLPSANFIFALSDQMQIRTAYGRTLARPTFKEISPSAMEEFGIGQLYQGNPDLEITTINNYDVRWEWYMRPGEVLAISGFYKYFSDPIELTLVGTNGDIKPVTTDKAKVYGLEFEFSRRLDHAFDFLRNFQVSGNLTLVHSSVTIPSSELEAIRYFDPNASETRPMAGQSPYIINLDLGYENPFSGTSATVYYNIFGRRLAINSEEGTPDIYEEPRHQLDFLASQRVFSGMKAKFSVKNILNESVEFAYDNSTLSTDQKYYYNRYERGVTYSLGLSYQIW